MELMEGIKTRRSIRKYKSEELPRELIDEILEDALWAPSAMNTQTWKILVFSGEKQKAFNKVVEDAVNHINARLKKLFNEGMQKRVHGFFKGLGGAPHTIVVLTARADDPKLQVTEIENGCALLYNVCLSAHARGIGTCWMSAPVWIEDTVLEYLGMQDDWKLVGITPMGHPDQNPPVPPRKGKPIEWFD
ncbi:MAG: nitroreductase family protein [Peptostreptococcales bacterium]